MSAETQAILEAGAQRYEQIMQSSLPSVTGKTKASIKSEVTINRMRGFARGFIHAIETGRGPRQSSTYSEYDERLEQWMKAKGFPTKQSKSGRTYYKIGQSWMTAKSLAHRINKDGDKTFRSGGKEVYSDQLDVLVNQMMKEVEAQKLKEYSNLFVKELGTLSNQTA